MLHMSAKKHAPLGHLDFAQLRFFFGGVGGVV